jgi:translation initiation factor 2B subunit (eIF-2B alpha/beta/delta family)
VLKIYTNNALDMELKRDIVSLFNNNTDGSSSLLSKLNRLLRKELKDIEYITLLIKESRKRFNSFSVIINYLNEIERELNNRDALLKLIDYYQDYEVEVNRRIFDNGRKYFLDKSKILTLSNSLTISSFLTSLYEINKKLEVIIAESRPKNEGRILAARLLKKGIPIEFITDFSSASYIPKSEAVITGADKILSNGNAVNKTGSRALAILCRYYNKPFYVITSKNKYSSEAIYKMEEKNPEEVWKFSNNKLKVRNYYFEEIERDLITRIITD